MLHYDQIIVFALFFKFNNRRDFNEKLNGYVDTNFNTPKVARSLEYHQWKPSVTKLCVKLKSRMVQMKGVLWNYTCCGGNSSKSKNFHVPSDSISTGYNTIFVFGYVAKNDSISKQISIFLAHIVSIY